MPEFDTTDGDTVRIERPSGEPIDDGVAVTFRELNPDRATGRIERVDDSAAVDLDALAGEEFAMRLSTADEEASYRIDGCRIDEASADAATWDAESVITETDAEAEGDVERRAG